MSDTTLISLHTNANINIVPNGSGQILLKADPVSALGAATKEYVDNLIGSTSGLGGSTGQVLYNSGGSISSTSKLTVDSDSYTIFWSNTGNSPLVPTNNNNIKLYSKLRSGRNLLTQLASTNQESQIQSSRATNSIFLWLAQGNSSGSSSSSVATFNFGNNMTGATTRTVATTNFFSSLRRIGFVSGNGSHSSAGTTHGILEFWTGSTAGDGGFYYIARFGMSSPATVATQRSFVGLFGTSTPLSDNLDPSANVNILGFAVDNADVTWSFIHSTTATTVTGSITGSTMTITSSTTGTLYVNQYISGNGIADGTTISSFGTGTGGVGTYQINSSQTVSSTTITGNAVKDPLTGTFPPRDLSVSVFEIRIFCPPNGGTIYYSIQVLNGGSVYDGSTSVPIPGNTVFLSPQIWTDTGTNVNNLTVGIDVISQYIETDF